MSADAATGISDGAFNALLGEFVELTQRVLNRTDRDHYQLMVVLATGADHQYRMIDQTSAGDGGPMDLLELMASFGAGLRRDGIPFDAVLVAGQVPAADGGETLLITGATPDGRRNGALLELRREERLLRVRTVKLQPYAPHTWVMQPKRHPAGSLIEGWLAAPAPASERPWWRFWR